MTLSALEIPPVLEPWKDWVLHDVKDSECPKHYQKNESLCSYPSKLEVRINNETLSFKFYIKIFDKQHKLFLPYVADHWIKNVTINGEEQIVLGSKKPFLLLDSGAYVIQGEIALTQKIKFLHLPKGVAIVSLLNGEKKVQNPKIDAQERLWLENKSLETHKKGTLSVSIYRKVKDGHPLSMKTVLNLRVSGKVRSVVLDGIVLKDFEPSSISSQLNARINEDKNLEVELKAGEWRIEVDAYATKNLTKLALKDYQFKYANQELLSFEADEKYRTIEIIDALGIDATQLNIPKSWKKLPLYLLEESRALVFKERYKSYTHAKDDLKLQREMWLDFDGKGYSFKDNIVGTISKIRRLEATNSLAIGAVMVNQKPMLINQQEEGGKKGVELRESSLNLKASGRYVQALSTLPINGWDETFTQVETSIHLPPAWSIFTLFGADSNGSDTWINQWNLMDIFLLLLLSISIFKLFGFKWSLFATLFLLLLWHEDNAPTYVWLWILALVSLLRVVNSSRIKKYLQIVLGISSFLLLLNILQFSVYEIRTLLYPQLEKHASYGNSFSTPYGDAYGSIAHDESMVYEMKEKRMNVSKSRYAGSNYVKKSKKELLMQNKIDPNAVVQTGEGVPNWNWSTYNLRWQSAVGKGDSLEIWFITPTMNKILKILNVVGMLFLFFMFLKEFAKEKIEAFPKGVMVQQSLKGLMIIGILGVSTPTLNAQSIPSAELLDELKSRLIKAPDCLPECVSIENIAFKVDDNLLSIEMKVASATNLAMPMVGNRNSWLPQSVKMDEQNSSDLQLDAKGDLWIHVTKGIHTIHLQGRMNGQNQFVLNSLLPLHNLTIESSKRWKIKTNHKDYVEFMNLEKALENPTQNIQSAIEAKISVKRVFYFGLRWYVDTEVRLLNSIDKPYTVNYKLLPHESILNKEIELREQKAVLHFSNEKKHYVWRSLLPLSSDLTIQASLDRHLIEQWHMDISSLWNVSYDKKLLREQKHVGNLLVPVFEPWAGEKLHLKLQKNKPVKGKSLTIESSHLNIVQSQRYRDLTLRLKIRSSQAQPYVLKLQGLKELSSVTIDNMPFYLKVEKDGTLSLPLKATSQEVVLKWREEQGSAIDYSFPSINLSKNSVNSSMQLKLPPTQWILFTSGSGLSPAVLLWGMLLAVILFSLILGRINHTPLKTKDWILLGLGVSTTSLFIMVPMVLWIFILRYKALNYEMLMGKKRLFIQGAIVLLTLVMLVTLVGAVSVGLLGNPEMMIAGNNSYGHNLNWYVDRVGASLEHPTVISVSIWYYRVLMLLWAIWIAFSLIKWLTWGWSIFSKDNKKV